MSGRSTSSRRDSASESESDISIGPGSVDSISSLRRGSKPRHVIFEGSEIDDGDTHSELDLSLYDTDEVLDSGERTSTSYRISLGSDGFESMLSDPDTLNDDIGEEGASPPLRSRTAFNSFVSTASSEFEQQPVHLPRGPLQQLHQQQQRLQTLQRQQQEQIQEQQQRFPRAYEAASISSTSFYQYLRGSLALGGSVYGGEADQATGNADHVTNSPFDRQMGATTESSKIRTNFTNTAAEAPLGTPSDPYDLLGTPPGDPPTSRPSHPPSEPNRSSTPFDEIHSQALQHLPRSMNSFLLLVLMAVGFGIGFAALSADPPEAYGYWLNEVGALYIRLVNCTAVPMGICQVVFSVSTLTARGALWRLWLKTLGFYLVVCLLSITMAIIVAGAFRSSLKQTDALSFETSTARFGFQCSNAKYLELNGTSLACNADTFDEANSTDTVFPSFVDVDNVLGLPESIAQLSFTQYFFTLGARYVPNNVLEALSADYYISSMVIATVLGVAVTRSFRGGGVGRDRGDARRNPLLRLFVHMYAALFTILDWLQSLVLVAILPLTIGSILVDPANATLASVAGNWCLATVLVCAIQSLVVCPVLFFWVTRRQPFGWLLKVMPALLYSVLLQSPLLPLAIATKSVLRSREVPPAVFGALFPVLAACNSLAQAVGLPVMLMWVVSYTDCGLPLNFSNSALLFGYAIVASLGDTAVSQSAIVYFLAVWRGFCGEEDLPPTPIALSGAMILISRLQALTNTATNLMIVRMAASTDEGRMYAHHFAM